MTLDLNDVKELFKFIQKRCWESCGLPKLRPIMKNTMKMKIVWWAVATCLCFPLTCIGEVYESWSPTVITSTKQGIASQIEIKEYVTTNVFIYSCGNDRRKLASKTKSEGEVKVWLLDSDLVFSVNQGGFAVPTTYRPRTPGSFPVSRGSNSGASQTPMRMLASFTEYPYALYISEKHTVDRGGSIVPDSIFESEGGENLSFGKNCYSKLIKYVLETSLQYVYCALFVDSKCYLFRIGLEPLRTTRQKRESTQAALDLLIPQTSEEPAAEDKILEK